MLIEKDPASVLWVEATATEASEGAAAQFLSSVAKLSLKGAEPINPEAWVNRNISTGGRYIGEGFELRLYGTEAARTLEIVAAGPPPEARSLETTKPSTTRQPTTTQGAK
jgi:hypothetical protein